MLNVLDLFSGIGGFSLGLERTGGFKTVAFCEIDPFCQKVLKKHWSDVPIYDDVRTLNYVGAVDVITGGYPCQPFSVSGHRKGEKDDRHLWPAMFSLIQKYRPSWVIGENVAGHINLGLDAVLSDLERESYAVRAFVIPACAVSLRHRRERVWIVAHADHQPGQHLYHQEYGRQVEGQEASLLGDDTLRIVPRCWTDQPGVRGISDGIPHRVDRVKSLGNSIVPRIPEVIGQAILNA